MQHQWEEVSIKIEVERIAGHEGATKAELHGYQPSHEDCTEYFREFLETLAPNDIHQEGYFVAYVTSKIIVALARRAKIQNRLNFNRRLLKMMV